METPLFARVATLAGVAVLAAACSSTASIPTDSTVEPTAAVTRQPTPLPSPTPFSVLTDTGVRGIMISDPGGVLRICETDAFVESLGGKARETSMAPSGFRVTPGEQIVHSTGEPLADDGTLVDLPVMRDAQGRLVLGWRHCEEQPSPQDKPPDEHASP